VSTFFTNNYPLLTPADTSAINAVYPLLPPLPEHAAYFPSASAAYGEATFTCPGILISLSYTQYAERAQVWNYRYNVLQASNVAAGLGVPHTFESPAIFGLGMANDAVTSSYASYNNEIIPVVMDYWISFVRDLDPNTFKYEGAPVWDSYLSGPQGGSRLKLQTNITAMEVVPQDQNNRCEFWRGLATVMEQ
jgi:acetylcholinesterase